MSGMFFETQCTQKATSEIQPPDYIILHLNARHYVISI